MKPMSEAAKYAPHLRRLGFRKDWKSVAGGERVDVWKRTEPADKHGVVRTITVQVWGDSTSRVCLDARPADKPNSQWSCTVPTDFTSVEELEAAIQHECTRMDHKIYALVEVTEADPK